MKESAQRAAGHRVVPHTADVIIEAWAPQKIECLKEAARALVESFAHVEEVAATEPVPIALNHDGDEGFLVSLLEEIIYVVDILGSVPVRVTLEETEDGGVTGFFDLAPAAAVEIHGSLPKGVSFTDLVFVGDDDGWRCRATIDV